MTYCVWAQVSNESPWRDWQEKLFAVMRWPLKLAVERWDGSDINWSKLIDSCNSFTLFNEGKVIVISQAEKAIKSIEDLEPLLRRLQKGPHRVIFQSELAAPANLGTVEVWKCPTSEVKLNEKSAFQWIDGIHSNQLTEAISALDQATQIQHPIALVQLITRDFRMGRLIHYAQEARMRETELSSALRIHGFVIQKWLRRSKLSRSQWAQVFDRLLQADLELKSGAEGVWVLRKLTFDLVQLRHSTMRPSLRKIKRPPLSSAPLLWTISPSYA